MPAAVESLQRKQYKQPLINLNNLLNYYNKIKFEFVSDIKTEQNGH